MNISACVITKNEEKNLPSCLNSLRNIVSEMIVVDTGSTDRTVEVAKSLGAQVFHFEWVHDFSKAKNYAISKATGDWIIFLDADEYFTKESLPLIPLLITEAEEHECDIIVSLLCNIDMHTKETINTVHHTRIFRNHPEICYEGAIHERIMRAGKAPRGLMASEGLAIIHTGYSSDIHLSKEKSERNIKLLYAQLENNPQSGEVYFYLAESYMAAREFEQALNYALLSDELDNCNLLGVKQKNYVNIITCHIYLNKDKKEIESWIRKGIERFPDYPDFHLLMANLYEQSSRYQDALESYTIGFGFIENALKSQSAAPHQAPKILTSMGEMNLKIGQLHEAVKHFMAALNIDKYHYLSLLHLLKLFTKFESVENTRNFLVKMFDVTNKKDLLYLTRASLETNSHVLAGYFISFFNESEFHQMQEEYAEYILLTGEYVKAVELYEAVYETEPNDVIKIRLLCAAYLSGSKELFDEYFDKYIGLPLFDDMNEGLSSLSTDELFQFISYLVKLEKPNEVIKFVLLITERNIGIQVADILYEREYYVEAEIFYGNYLSKNESEGDIRSILLIKQGECLWRSGRYEEAKILGYEARSLNPQDYRTHSLLMSITSETEELEELNVIVQEAINVFPDSRFLQTLQSVLDKQTTNFI